MITKEGIITETSGSMAWVKTTRSKSCDSCESRDSCGEHSKIEDMTIHVENSLNASTGDRIVVGLKTAPLLKITFLLYIFPIILMMVGAAIGEVIAIRLNMDKSIISMFFGLICFIISFLIIRFINNICVDKKEYQPFMMRFVQKTGSCSVKSSIKPS
ncbi:MAG: SoxR reducing system RseC family protein [Desulfamplus sp.]|nr:SoxR reducing system RseC family protein [Desulfamplus sp.]MBF0412496.1 SoxR reducing system RseC family protein [Desulfamplus sp.]